MSRVTAVGTFPVMPLSESDLAFAIEQARIERAASTLFDAIAFAFVGLIALMLAAAALS